MTTEHDKLVTIDYFVDMVGMGRQWFYKHHKDAGMPRRVYVGGKPMLPLSECLGYVAELKARRGPIKRKRGRPRKAAPLAVTA